MAYTTTGESNTVIYIVFLATKIMSSSHYSIHTILSLSLNSHFRQILVVKGTVNVKSPYFRVAIVYKHVLIG